MGTTVKPLPLVLGLLKNRVTAPFSFSPTPKEIALPLLVIVNFQEMADSPYIYRSDADQAWYFTFTIRCKSMDDGWDTAQEIHDLMVEFSREAPSIPGLGTVASVLRRKKPTPLGSSDGGIFMLQSAYQINLIP